MHISSAAFSDGSPIPRRYTCDGEDLSPPVEWSNPPEETRSFVLLCNDPDAPFGTWHHWAAYDLPPNLRSLPEDATRHAERHGFKQAINDFNRAGYGGPCPPHHHAPHHYSFLSKIARPRPAAYDGFPIGCGVTMPAPKISKC